MVVNDTDGAVLYGADIRGMGQIKEIYTGTGFDTDTTTSENQDHELTAITSSEIGNADYLVIEISLFSELQQDEASESNNKIQIQTKEVGGGYSDSLAETNIHRIACNSVSVPIYDDDMWLYMKWVHTLTAGEKSNGVQVKILVESNASATNGRAAITNKQTILSTGY